MGYLLQNFFSPLDVSNLSYSHPLTIVLLLAVGFVLASILGYLAMRIKLSPILGYLLAGYLIGPFSPGFVANIEAAKPLAEIGVILMMFGIGLNFKLKEMLKVKSIALTGALGQTIFTTIIATLIMVASGWSWSMGVILGLAIGVASTVVLVRMLADNHLLSTEEGHISVGWLLTEDLFTVFVLVLLPFFAEIIHEANFSYNMFLYSFGSLLVKWILLLVILGVVGPKAISYIFSRAEKTKSHELFTISLLAFIFCIAVGSTIFFGISVALGAFIAGMLIGQTKRRAKALEHSLSIKDVFVAIFFLSMGMLFNPRIIAHHFALFIGILAIIILFKPLVALLICILFRYPLRTSLIVAIALAQIGEFSFILTEEAIKYGLMSDVGYNLIVACSLISIAINPLLFKLLNATFPKPHKMGP